uniref:U1 small nuclear ribonucleoprotein C n=1 Tax=Oryctolagus cuniculus TaxID=9986 RepID=A0A5F9C724_RABIT
MPEFYCDYCDMYLTHDSPSGRKTHCSGRKHKENVKDYYQKWMEEQAPSLIHKTTAAFQQGKIPPTPFSAPPPAGAMIPPPPSLPGPPRPGMMPAPHMGGHMTMMPGPPMMRPPARFMMVPTHPGKTRRTDKERGEASSWQFCIACPASPGDHGAVTLGVF